MARVSRIAARAFTHRGKMGGGNPVTIFLNENEEPLTKSTCQYLAQSCDWESVIVSLSDISRPKFHFYMPSGEEVSYCAHAAMGASFLISKTMGGVKDVPFVTAEGAENNATVEGNNVQLRMKNDLTEMELDTFILKEMLRQVNLELEDITHHLPLINSSVARYKTLVPVSLEKLHFARPPENADHFRDTCDSLKSTGLYLYTPIGSMESLTFEARQFPRFSGYPEDPATGIAAAALISSIHKTNRVIMESLYFKVNQGTVMGKPSQIGVKVTENEIVCAGDVEIDEEKFIHLER